MTTKDHGSDEPFDLADLMRHEYDADGPGAQIDRARRRRRRRIALIITASIIIAALAGTGGYIGWALTAPLGAPTMTTETPRAPASTAVTVSMPNQGAAAISVSGADEYLGAESNGIWAASGASDAQPIASISKLITALVILDAYPLASADDQGPTITFDKADHDLYDEYYVMGATIAAMPTGSSMSLRDALATMLIPSASNYAEAVSIWAFGSQNAFVRATRDWLAANGLTGTTIDEPTGISASNSSTPSDLIALGKLAAANPTIAQIAATPSLGLEGPGQMYNTNSLLGVGGVTGLKTGNLGPGSHNLLYTATVEVGAAQPLSVTGIVLGGQSRDTVNSSVLASLDSIRAGFHTVPLATRGTSIGSLTTAWGGTAQVVIGGDASIFTWSDTPIIVSMETTTPITYDNGEVIGSITWTAGPNTATAPVVIEGTIEPPTEWWRLTNPSELG